MGRKKNSFSKAINHLKSKNIDEKLEMLNEIPTNNTSSIYSVVPNSVTVGVDISQTVPDYSSIDFEIDGNDGRDTSGLFDESGNSKFIAPPGDNSYILGPMAAMYYTWSTPWTKIGYIRESDRRMVNLGTLYSTLHIGGDATGKLSDWDGNLRDGNGNQIFYANGQLTLEQAQWFLNTPKKDNAGNDPANANYRAFYPGPPSNAADEFGRYLCTMTGTPKGTREDILSKKTAPMGQQGSDNFSAMLDRQGQGGSGSLKATYDLDYFNQTGKKPKNAPKNWDKMSDKKKKEWLEKNPQTLSFDYKDGKFQERPPEQQQQQPNPFDQSQDPLADIPLDKQFGADSPLGDPYANYGTGRDGTFGTGTSGEGMPSNPNFRGAGNNKNFNNKNEAEVESMVDKLKDHWSQTWEDVKNFPKDLKKFGQDLLDMIDEVTDKVPAIDYSKDIADSILSNKPKDNSDKISEEDKEKLFAGLNYDSVKINDKKEPYADDNIITDKDGKVRPRTQWPTDENGNEILDYNSLTDELKKQADAWYQDQMNHPNNTKPVHTEKSQKEMESTMGVSNPLAAAGQAQVQVYTNENGEYIFSYTDHAYHNINSKDEGEVPGLGFINPKLWISKAVHAISDARFGRTSNGENTGGMEGYPAGIYGDSIKQFEVKVNDMPKEFRDWFNSQINQKNSYKPRGRIISESRKTNIMKTLKDPIVIRETKQKSYKVKPGRRSKKSNYHQGMDKLIGDVKPQKSFKKPQNMWSQGWQEYNARSSQDRKNIVLEKIGESKHAWKYMLEHGTMMDAKNLEEFWGKNPDFYSYFFNGKKYKTVRKEQVKGDYVVFLVDESGAKSSMLQSELNIKLIEEEEKKMLAEYNKLNNIESIPYEKDPLFKKVSKRLKKEIDYPEKPAKKGYPNQPPPKLGPDGFHPDFGKKYKYDKLDPISATTMSNAPTGNPEIDANVKKASLKSKVKEGYSDWRSEIEKK